MSAGFRPLQALWQSSFCAGPPLARQTVQWGAWLVSTTLALRLRSTTPILLHPKSAAIIVPQFKPAWSINNFGFWKLNNFISTTVLGLPYILSPHLLKALNFWTSEQGRQTWEYGTLSVYPHFLSLPHVSSPSHSFVRQSYLLAADPRAASVPAKHLLFEPS